MQQHIHFVSDKLPPVQLFIGGVGGVAAGSLLPSEQQKLAVGQHDLQAASVR